MSSQRFSVETRGQAALILGEPSSLTTTIISQFKSRGIYATLLPSTNDLSGLTQVHDLDYILYLDPYVLPSSALAPLQNLLQSHQSRLFLAHHYASPTPSLPLSPTHLDLLYVDCLGPDLLYSPTLQAWRTSILSHRSLTIPHDGLAELGLLSLSDLGSALVTAVTRPQPRTGASLLIAPDSNSISLLNLAYDLRSALPYKLSLVFAPDSPPPSPIPTLPRLDFTPTTPPADLISSFSRTLTQATPPAPLVSPASPSTPPISSPAPTAPAPLKLSRLHPPTPVFVPLTPARRRASLRPLLPRLRWRSTTSHHPLTPFNSPRASTPPRLRHILVRGLAIALGLYLGSLAFAGTIVFLSLRPLASTLAQGSLPRLSPLTTASTTFLEANLVAISLLRPLGSTTLIQDSLLGLDAYQQTLTILAESHKLSLTTSRLAQGVLAGRGGDIPQLISSARLQSESLYQQLALLDGSLPVTPPPSLPSRYHDNYNTLKVGLAKLKRSALTSKAVLAALPDLIGLGGRKKYAVLFQNNLELRPTGGFIGSLGILSFENGTLYDMPIFDVYQADQALKGRVEPPLPIQEILGETNWYLRDSNFDPDFPVSARRAEWFIQKTLNQDVDGTLALNLHSLSQILTATGPLALPDYNETISSANLVERAQYHAEVNYFPSPAQNKEFLSAVGAAIFTHLTSSETFDFSLAQSLYDSLDGKNTLISVTNPGSDHVFSALGWNGGLVTAPDSAFVVDSNFGVNKANYYIRRSFQDVINLSADYSVTHKFRARYTHTATNNAWPSGVYKNYQRFYLPASAIVDSLRVGENLLSSRAYTVTSTSTHTIVAHTVSLPVNSSLEIEVSYHLPPPRPSSPSYSWYWQKQPGTSSADNLTVYLNYPAALRPTLISPPAELGIQQLQFDFPNDTDHRISVQFGP